MDIAKIYVLVDPLTNQPRWIGKTSKRYLADRLANICSSARGKARPLGCSQWVASLLAQGFRPEIHLLEEVADWPEAERFWIAYFRFIGADLTNISPGGDSAPGHQSAQVSRDKISAKKKGSKRPEGFGRQMSEALKGRKPSQETLDGFQRWIKVQPRKPPKPRPSRATGITKEEANAKRSAAMRGVPKPPRTPEHAAKIAAALRGRKSTPEQNAKRRATMLARIAAGLHQNQHGPVEPR